MEVENLKAYLANINMSIKEFAELLGYNQGYICKIASGERKPGIGLAKTISEITDGKIKLKTNEVKKKCNCKNNHN